MLGLIISRRSGQEKRGDGETRGQTLNRETQGNTGGKHGGETRGQTLDRFGCSIAGNYWNGNYWDRHSIAQLIGSETLGNTGTGEHWDRHSIVLGNTGTDTQLSWGTLGRHSIVRPVWDPAWRHPRVPFDLAQRCLGSHFLPSQVFAIEQEYPGADDEQHPRGYAQARNFAPDQEATQHGGE